MQSLKQDVVESGPASQPYSPIPVEQAEEPVSKPAVHTQYPTQEGTKKLPYACRDFRNGKCTRGENCKFMHVYESMDGINEMRSRC